MVCEVKLDNIMTITVTLLLPQYQVVVLDVDSFDLEESDNCTSDFLTIYEVYSMNSTEYIRQLAVLCGYFSPFSIHSAFSTVIIIFESDGNATETGFSLEYETTYLASKYIAFVCLKIFVINSFTWNIFLF